MPQLSDFIQQIPQEQLIFQVILPFIVVFAILWGALESLGTFSRRINLVLALSFTTGFAITDYFLWFSRYLINLGSFLVLAAFLALFGFGILRWMFGRGRDVYYETGPDWKRIERINKEIVKLTEKMNRVKESEKAGYMQRIHDLELKKRIIESESRY